MEQLGTVEGLTETQPETESLTSRLAEMLASHPSRSQDELEKGLGALERAYSSEPNKRLKSNIERAIKLLRYGPEDGDASGNESLYHDE